VEPSAIRVLVVDDYEPWHRFVATILQKQPELKIMAQARDGLEAVQQAQELHPDLILLDMGLPTINGLEAARRIRKCAPQSKILVVSENRSLDIVEEAVRAGAGGYVVKSDAATELLFAIEEVLKGKRFVSPSLASQDSKPRLNAAATVAQRHEVAFYVDDADFVDGTARFIGTSLQVGTAVIVIASERHHANLRELLVLDGLNVTAEIKLGRYFQLEVKEALSSFMVNDSPDPALFRKFAIDLVTEAASGAKGRNSRVAVCGEGVHALLAAGNSEAAIQLERMWNEVAQAFELDILCAYFRSSFVSEENASTLERVSAEHSAVHGL
jgi:DNA-binding NarL/FixJ family response regulator